MREDEAHWAENFEGVKRQAKEIEEQVKVLFERQQAEFRAMMNISLSMRGEAELEPSLLFTHRKLQILGK